MIIPYQYTLIIVRKEVKLQETLIQSLCRHLWHSQQNQPEQTSLQDMLLPQEEMEESRDQS